MRNHRTGAARAAALCAAAAAVAAFIVPDASAVSALSKGTSPASSAGAAESADSRVVLPTGDTVVLSAAGEQVLPGGPSPAFSTYRDTSGDSYLIPAEAAPFAGRALDMSLFDVTQLARTAQSTADGRIPVSLTFGAGATPSAPAGVTLTAVSGQTATGYLTPASGAAFAAALRQRIAADKAAGRTVGSGGLEGLSSMRVVGAGTPVTPDYPMRILQINAIGMDGAPLDGFFNLVNTDDSRKMTLFEPIDNGVARVALPAGNYAAYLNDYSFDSQGMPSAGAMVAVNDFAVPAAGDVPALTLDARTATAPVSVTTPRPATLQESVQQMVRTPIAGPAVAAGMFGIEGAVPITMSPAPAAKVGEFLTDMFQSLSGPTTASEGTYQYQYFTDFESDRIEANQTHHLASGDLAAETEDVDSDPALAGLARSVGATPIVTGIGVRFRAGELMPSKSTSYFTPGPWSTTVWGPWPSGPGKPQGPSLTVGARIFHAGQTSERTWGQAPSAPAFGRYPEAAAWMDCQACVGAGNMDLEFDDAGDSNPDTVGADYDGADTAAVYWNGQKLPPPPIVGSPTVIVSNIGTGPATVRAVLDTDHPAGEKQSTNTHTDVTFQYTGQTDPFTALPDGNYCPAAIAAGQQSAPCQIMPILTIGYQYGALSQTNVALSPVQSLVLDIGHHSFGGYGSHAPITSAQASVSFDGGTTWQDVPTLGADGHYAALWRNPAPGTSVTVRVTATDAIGGTITQTVANPYTVG
ncbi:hypothetical protein KGQ19_10695 [Catenulispora sp. NL8]|uniref:Peptidase S8 and S53 subtilisin kexin sedolisin n=1 Tax=Catenulispora pinistramenti TaxID=2705254 RepID=A0ABS5KMQ1_9ACTN|nr:hypothetical protein [Catenulispora pinistramenti]MBS2547342.1 hypothetical protein [Catenulispora pinistramenti]